MALCSVTLYGRNQNDNRRSADTKAEAYPTGTTEPGRNRSGPRTGQGNAAGRSDTAGTHPPKTDGPHARSRAEPNPGLVRGMDPSCSRL